MASTAAQPDKEEQPPGAPRINPACYWFLPPSIVHTLANCLWSADEDQAAARSRSEDALASLQVRCRR